MEQANLAKLREKTRVGAWYSLWYDDLEEGSFWDTVKNDFGEPIPIRYKPLLPGGTFDRYDSGDEAVIQFHLDEISKAGIDFLIFDQTNNIDVTNAEGRPWIHENSLKTAQMIQRWNEAGNKPIKYCSAIGAYATVWQDYNIIESEAKKLWERYIEQPWGTPEHHEYVNGKPLLVLFTITKEQWEAWDGDKTYADRFEMRFSVGHAYDPGFWGWVIPFGATVTEDVCCIIPGWFKLNHPLEKVYRERGRTYQENWERLLRDETVPDFVVINSINEYAEQTAIWPADTSGFPEDNPVERWLNPEGEEDPYLYWNMTKKYIEKYRRGDRI